MELRERGWSILAAAREVGVSRTAGNNWARGHKTYRKGMVVGFVPPLERLTVRQISARFLPQDERVEIAEATLGPCLALATSKSERYVAEMENIAGT